jgi:hypothetical protein
MDSRTGTIDRNCWAFRPHRVGKARIPSRCVRCLSAFDTLSLRWSRIGFFVELGDRKQIPLVNVSPFPYSLRAHTLNFCVHPPNPIENSKSVSLRNPRQRGALPPDARLLARFQSLDCRDVTIKRALGLVGPPAAGKWGGRARSAKKM